MDPFTHALSGALIAQAAAPPARPDKPPLRARLAAGALGALFPDVDIALRLVDTLFYLNWHQGHTHSLVLAPLWAGLLAYAAALLARGRYPWHAFYTPILLGLLVHVAGDLVTAYGTMLLAPFSTRRYALGYVFVVDAYITAALAAGMLSVLFLPFRRGAALLAIAGTVGYVVYAAGLKREAAEIGVRHAEANALHAADVHALPQPLSPYNWKVLVREDQALHEAHVRVREAALLPLPRDSMLARMNRAYSTPRDAQWIAHRFGRDTHEAALARDAWAAPQLEPLRRFIAFPVVVGMRTTRAVSCVSIVDLRFTLPAFPPSFVFNACRDPASGTWTIERVRGKFWID